MSAAALRLVYAELESAGTLPGRAEPTLAAPQLAVDPPSVVEADASLGVRVVPERSPSRPLPLTSLPPI